MPPIRPDSRAAALRPLGLILVLAAAVLSGCTDPPPPPAPEPVAPGEETPEVKALRERAAKLREETEKEWDRQSRGYLASFASRAYDPRRDAGLVHAKGTMRVRSGDAEARYRFTFDADHPPATPVTFEVVSEPAGWDPALTTLARRIATQSFVGPYRIVVFHNPPNPFVLHPGKEKGEVVVHVPPFRTPLNVSYAIDERQVVTARGEWTDETHKAVTKYTWETYHNRYLVQRESIHDGADIDFEYDRKERLVLLKRAVVRSGERTDEILFEDVETRTR